MTDPIIPHTDRRVTWVLVLSGIVAVLVILGTPAIINASSTSDEVARSQRLDSCRSSYASRVTDARTDFDVARSERDTAATELGLLTNAGLQAAVEDNDDRLSRVFASLPAARALVEEREKTVAVATKALREAADTYVEQASLARTDPDAFLASCH